MKLSVEKLKRVGVIAAIVANAFVVTGCVGGRVETGKTGIRTNWDNTVNPVPVPAGWYWAWTSDVTPYVTNEISLPVDNIPAQAKDRSFVKEYDVILIYSVNPSTLVELHTQYARRHRILPDGTIYPFGEYLSNLVLSTAPKAVEPYDALNLAEHRTDIENSIVRLLNQSLVDKKLADKVRIHGVMVKKILPDPRLTNANLSVLEAQRAKERKLIEVETASIEAQRAQKLMDLGERYAELRKLEISSDIAKAIGEGKVNTIVVPQNFTSVGSVNK